MSRSASVAPRWGTAVTFLHAEAQRFDAGAPNKRGPDPTMQQAIAWLSSITTRMENDPANVGAQQFGLATEELRGPGSPSDLSTTWRGLADQVLAKSAEAAKFAGKHLKDDMRRKYLGGLPPGLTLVLVTHGIESDRTPDPNKPKDSRNTKSGGLALTILDRARTSDKPAFEWLLAAHLSNMKVDGGRVVFAPGERAPKEQYHGLFEEESQAFVPIVDALRRSRYDRIYLLACGDPPHLADAAKGVAGRLQRFAELLQELTGKVIYYNTLPIVVGKFTKGSTTTPTLAVNNINSPTPGPAYTKPQAPPVPLRGIGAFLPGSMKREGAERSIPVLDMTQAKVLEEIQGVFKKTVKDFKQQTGLRTDGWGTKTEGGFETFLSENVPGFTENNEDQLLFQLVDAGKRKIPSPRGAVLIYRDILVHYRRDDAIQDPDAKALADFPLLGAFERATDGVGGGELTPPKLVS